MDIRFYYVDTKYIDYLKQYEISHRGFTCVPNVTYDAHQNQGQGKSCQRLSQGSLYDTDSTLLPCSP